MRIVTLVDDRLKLKFGGDHFKADLEFVKGEMTGASFDPVGRAWFCDHTQENVDKLIKCQWRFMGDAYFITHERVEPVKEEFIPKEITVPLHEKTRPFQKEAVEFLLSRGKRSILSLPPGCGKSLIAISWLKQLPQGKPFLVISPAGLKNHWKRELKQWCDIDSHIISGGSLYVLPPAPVYIINYEILTAWLKGLPSLSGFIADECHLIKEPTAKRTKAVISLAKRDIYKVFLSATPIKSYPKEFWTVLHMVAPSIFTNKYAYLNRYCDPKPGYMGAIEYKGASNVGELHDLVSHYMLRKEKSEILPDLPKKNRIVYDVVIKEDDSEYYKAQARVIDLCGRGAKKYEIDEALRSLSRSAYYGKKYVIHDKIGEYLSQPEEKIVIVAYHHAVLDDLIEIYGKDACVIDGRVPSQKRQAIVDDFNTNPKKRIMIAQMQAGGVGFSMTAAHTMIFAELYYIPGDVAQMEDRIHRMTSEGDHVDYIFFVGIDTVEEDMIYALNKKTEMIGAVLDGNVNSKYFTEDEFYDRIKKRKNNANRNKGKAGR